MSLAWGWRAALPVLRWPCWDQSDHCLRQGGEASASAAPPSVGQQLLIGACCAFMGTLCLCSARPLLKYKGALKQGQRVPCPPLAPTMRMVHIN